MPPKTKSKKKPLPRRPHKKAARAARRGGSKATPKKTARASVKRAATSRKSAPPAKRGVLKKAPVKKLDRLEELFAQRDQWRGLLRKAISLVEGKKLKWEINRQGKMRWYLHPNITNTSLRSLLVFMQEIPPGSRSGKQKHQGGIVHFVLKGRGYTVVNGKRHDWEAGDTISLPVFPDGIEYQHFNSDPGAPVVFIAAQASLGDPLGVDMGSGLEQIENCPEYKG
ncbi:MAG TPA: cupin domain-containing protein [bacterium]|nr:cupin domain-containing protein [bacterium]